MAYIPRSSFIAKESSGAIPMQMRKRRTIHIFSSISMVLLVSSLLAAAGTFFYTGVVEGRLEAIKGELLGKGSADDARKMKELQVFDRKLSIAHTLLGNHLAPSLVFEELENSAKQTVQFKSLEYTYDPGFEAVLTLAGATKEFASVALQKMQFVEDSQFSVFVVQDITTTNEVDETGKDVSTAPNEKVSFSITGLFKSGILEYTGTPVVTQRASSATSGVNPVTIPVASTSTPANTPPIRAITTPII